MNPLAIAKTVSGIVVSMGAGAVVSNAIKASTPSTAKVITKITIGIGGFVISGMVGEMAVKYTNHNIDEAVNQFKQLKPIITSDQTEEV